MEQCIAATEAINSLRSLLGYHPGQRIAAVDHVLGRRDDGNRPEFEPRGKRYATTLGKAAEPRTG